MSEESLKHRPEVPVTSRTLAQSTQRVEGDVSSVDMEDESTVISPSFVKRKKRNPMYIDPKDLDTDINWMDDATLSVMLLQKFESLGLSESEEDIQKAASEMLGDVAQYVGKKVKLSDIEKVLKENLLGKSSSKTIAPAPKPKKEVFLEPVLNEIVRVCKRSESRADLRGEEFELCKLYNCSNIAFASKYEGRGPIEENHQFIAVCALEKDKFPSECPQKQPLPPSANIIYEILLERNGDEKESRKLSLKASLKMDKING